MILHKGIDTSKWQGSKVDYNLYKQSGGYFVFLRVGCKGTKDPCFETDYANAVKAGLKVGVYFYTKAISIAEATADATRVLGWLNDRHLDFPIGYDVEDAKQKKLTKALNSNLYNAFKAKIEASGIYDAILYTGENFYNTYFDKSRIDDDLWIAKYASKQPSVGRDIAIWQFTSDAISESFYKGKLDQDYLFTDSFKGSSEQIITESLNPYAEPTRNLKLTLPRMQGNDVKWLQTELGFSESHVDGIFGKETQYHVILWQKAHGLKADGIVGSATRYSLKYD